jgi:hypothetical protein
MHSLLPDPIEKPTKHQCCTTTLIFTALLILSFRSLLRMNASVLVTMEFIAPRILQSDVREMAARLLAAVAVLHTAQVLNPQI